MARQTQTVRIKGTDMLTEKIEKAFREKGNLTINEMNVQQI